MKRNAPTLSLTMVAVVVVSALLRSSNLRLAFAATSSDTSKECKDAADKISSKAEAHQSNNVCGIELSRDSPTITLNGKKINEQVPMEFPYQPASASSNSQVLMLTEFTLLQSEVDKVNQYLRDHHWTVGAIHNHWFDESPRLIFLHAQKLQQTNCGCV
jgi:hypothetical protein